MDEITEENYKYSAFISYSHKNMKDAAWVQNQLERFRLPGSLKRQHPDAHKMLAPVFRDKTDFNTGELEEIVEGKLRESRYLIVICSPESAASEYVNREISYFISLGREKNIIPFIISGNPGGTDDNCYPPALKLSIIGANAKADGRQKAFVRVVATMLTMDFDHLWRREHRRETIHRIHGACVALMLALCLITGIIAVLPHYKYYRTITTRYGVAVGIGEVNREERKHMNCFYRITTQLGDVSEVECLNSAYELTTPVMGELEDASRVVYKDGLNRVEYYDSANILRFVAKYSTSSLKTELAGSSSETLTVAMDYLENDEGSGTPTTLGANSSTGLLDVQNEAFAERSGIVRKLLTFDADGYLIREMYMLDSRNTPVMDSLGNYGVAYTYYENGQKKTEVFLDSEGNPHDCNVPYACTTTVYDERGLIAVQTVTTLAGEPATDADYICMQVYEWSEEGNLVQISLYDTDRELLIPELQGYSIAQNDYDENGFLAETRTYGPDGELYPANEACVIRYTHDERGNVLTKKYFDAEGDPVQGDEGACGVQYTYDGRTCTACTWLDENGKPTEIDGVCTLQLTYNSDGYISDQVYLDANGTPTVDTETGIGHVHAEYQNDALTEYWCLDANGVPVLSSYGFYVLKYSYDGNGNQAGWTAYGLHMEPVETTYGFSSYVCEHNEQGQLVTLTYYDAEGWPVAVDGIARYDCEYDDMARMTENRCYDKNGVLTSVNDYTYDEDGSFTSDQISYTYYSDGSMQVEHRTEDGSGYTESFDEDSVLTVRETFDADGNLTLTEVYDADGVLQQTLAVTRPAEDEIVYTLSDADGNALNVYYCDAEEREKSCETYYANGVLSEVQTFDENGELVERICYDADGTETLHQKTERDADGRISRMITYDTDGLPALVQAYTYADDGTSTVELSDADGNCLSCIVYNLSGKPIEETDYDGQGQETSHEKREFDDEGRLKKVTWFAANGTVTGYGSYRYYDDGSYSLEIYHANRTPQAMWNYDESGNKIIETEYDLSGRICSETYFDTDGTVLQRAEYSYSDSGLCTTYTTDGDGTALSTVVTDINDRVTEQILYTDGVETSHETSVYDDSGRLIRDTWLNPDGTLHDYTETIYADDGSCTVKSYSSGSILVNITHFSADGTEIRSAAWPPV